MLRRYWGGRGVVRIFICCERKMGWGGGGLRYPDEAPVMRAKRPEMSLSVIVRWID